MANATVKTSLLLDGATFQSQYGDAFQSALAEAKRYVADPASLAADIAEEEKSVDRSGLIAPAPDPYAYRLMRYRGFVRLPDRLKNYLVANDRVRQSDNPYLPTLIDVEPISRCNFRCIMCTVSEWKNGERAEDLTFEALKDLLDQHPYILEMKLQGLGEPLLHENFIDMVQYAAERDIWVRSTVNGSLLHARDNYKRLIDSGIGEVQTSFDGATKEIFEKIRVKSDFDRVVRNLTQFNEYANTKDRLYTRMWVVVQKYNRHQIFEFVELAKQMGFRRMTFSVNLGSWGTDDWAHKTEELFADSITDEEQHQLAEISVRDGIDISIWGTAPKYSTESVETLCPAPFFRASTTSDNRLVPCSLIGSPEIADLGDATDFVNAWNGPKYRGFRKAHLNGKIPNFCSHCYK